LQLTPHQAKYIAHDLTLQHAGGGLDRLSQALFNASVDLNPHQIEAAVFALRSPLSKGVLLADEVGLGKTIEAGIVLCQYWAERKRQLLVICPASLRKQWALELQDKFNLPAAVLDSKTWREAQRQGLAPLRQKAVVIVSYAYASVLVHKPSISEPEVFQQQPYALYHYATRLLVERVSWLCRDHYRTGQGDGTVEMVFSNRSAMSYDNLRGYLSKLKLGQAGSDVRVDWSVVDPQRIRAVNHDQLAGLQLADAVASGVFFSVHRNPYGDYEDRYLRLMGKTIYRNKGTVDGYGLKLWCADAAETARVLEAADAVRQVR
jgi:hypothetical protein